VPISARTHQIAAAHLDGRPVAAIAAELGITESTVLTHLWNYLRAGNELAPGTLLEQSTLSDEERNLVISTFDDNGTDYLRPVYLALNQTVSYDELQLIRLYYLTRAAEEAPESMSS
jgi:ATP-dependent DNA helicase RecQ